MAIRSFSTSNIKDGTKRSEFWDGYTGLGSYESIASFKPTANSTGFTFNNIPQNYKHLQLRYKINNSAAAYYVRFYFNIDTETSTSIYTNHSITTDFAGNSAVNDVNVGYMYSPRSSDLSQFNHGVVDIFDYSNSNKHTTVKGYGGYNNASSARAEMMSSMYKRTDAVTSITFNFVAGLYGTSSRIDLYGIKG